MTKRVLDVGQCSMDHSAISSCLSRAVQAETSRAHGWDDAEARLSAAAESQAPFDLVLVNRVLDRDGGDGLEIIRQLKADPRWSQVPVMLVSNYADAQRNAQTLGAAPGFGKNELNSPTMLDRVKSALAGSPLSESR